MRQIQPPLRILLHTEMKRFDSLGRRTTGIRAACEVFLKVSKTPSSDYVTHLSTSNFRVSLPLLASFSTFPSPLPCLGLPLRPLLLKIPPNPSSLTMEVGNIDTHSPPKINPALLNPYCVLNTLSSPIVTSSGLWLQLSNRLPFLPSGNLRIWLHFRLDPLTLSGLNNEVVEESKSLS